MSTTVVRTTTDKLEAVIAEQESESRTLTASQFVGGRDWVLFFTQMIALEATSVTSAESVLTDLAAQLISLSNAQQDKSAHVDRNALVAELRRQVAAGRPEDDENGWRVGFSNLANSLDGTDWLAPV